MATNITTDASNLDNVVLVRLLCLNMVMQNGAEVDRCAPCEKADKLAKFVLFGRDEAVREEPAPPIVKPKK